jgi:hypothetical protein
MASLASLLPAFAFSGLGSCQAQTDPAAALSVADQNAAAKRLDFMVEQVGDARLSTGLSRVKSRTFLNRDYKILELPQELVGLPRYSFDGGAGTRVHLRFRKATVVFAAFEYNDSGAWSFEDGRSAKDFGWHLWRADAYRGSSNGEKNGQPYHTSIWFREFKPKQDLLGLPAWWVCLGIADLETAKKIEGFRGCLVSDVKPPVRRYSHATTAAHIRPLNVPPFESTEAFRNWQTRQRKRFIDRMLYPYKGKISVSRGEESQHESHVRQEFHVELDGQRLFRFFRQEPRSDQTSKKRPTMVCFMGHGKVAQILDGTDSYQHACATHFVKAGYIVFAMENVGMEPGRDTHHYLDQSLRLEGHGWYSLLFAHQRILLDQVFADSQVDSKRVGVTGVSTGGLLALSAAVIEPRVAAASVQGIFGSMRVSFIRDRHRHCSCGAMPGLLPEFDLPELALLVAPRPLHISNGRTDGFSPAEAERCVDIVTPLYRQAGGLRPRFTISPGGHEYSLNPAVEFFAEYLAASELE